ncbi:single-stranded DNA-binding protein [Gramella jeungdoensis]|uniref:Single-stranded DNA-binding protein n=1 Tax=Gramella jeungdoensis TaxID=708091 RepID=A0ABT0Z857_9FLAO|nr:single-stranded DNA-binding protein [Gramella jeungdoensis]MCM8570929.1 single-stranded DNA-binding protein [Gramella jeungdoensis]
MTGTLNKVMLIGHTGDDVKMHYFEGGGSIGRFPLATNESYTNRTTGERVTSTEWHNVVVRNKAAEICEKYLKKGDKVYVEGRIKTRKWQDDQGNERYQTEIHCTEFTFLTPKNESGAEPSGNSQASGDRAAKPKNENYSNRNEAYSQDEEEDDLPF